MNKHIQKPRYHNVNCDGKYLIVLGNAVCGKAADNL